MNFLAISSVTTSSVLLSQMLFPEGLAKQSPGEGARMLSLIKSHRTQVRVLSPWKRAIENVAMATDGLRRRFGLAQSERRKQRFSNAGWKSKHSVNAFLAWQAGGLLLGAFLGGICSRGLLFPALIGGMTGFALPDLFLTRAIKSRRECMRRSIPDMVDLLVVCVGAGLGLDQALLRVGEELRLAHPVLAGELERVTRERQAGTPRSDAWKAFSDRTQLQEVGSFASMLAETDRFGSPISKALSDFADELRLRRRQNAEEAAAKTKVKILFPLVLCIFPCLFIVLLAPALLSMARSFSVMSR